MRFLNHNIVKLYTNMVSFERLLNLVLNLRSTGAEIETIEYMFSTKEKPVTEEEISIIYIYCLYRYLSEITSNGCNACYIMSAFEEDGEINEILENPSLLLDNWDIPDTNLHVSKVIDVLRTQCCNEEFYGKEFLRTIKREVYFDSETTICYINIVLSTCLMIDQTPRDISSTKLAELIYCSIYIGLKWYIVDISPPKISIDQVLSFCTEMAHFLTSTHLI